MNVPLEIHYYPGARAKYLANEGELDGYLTSTPALLKYFSNIVLVPEPYLYLEMVAVVQKQEIKTTGWKSFENYSVGYIRGQKFIESRLPTDLPNVHVVDNEKQLIGMLDAGRIDCFIILKTVAINIVNNNKALDLKIVSLPFAKMDTYLTLHKKHKSFVPKLVKAITEFKEETASERRSR